MIKKIAIIGCLFTFGCSTQHTPPIVYPDSNHDPAQYKRFLAACESWAEGAAVEGTKPEGFDAVLGAIFQAATGLDPGLSATDIEHRRQAAVLLCLKKHGYDATYGYHPYTPQ